MTCNTTTHICYPNLNFFMDAPVRDGDVVLILDGINTRDYQAISNINVIDNNETPQCMTDHVIIN